MDIANFRVYLRAFEMEDYKTTLPWRNNDELWSMLVGRKYFVSSEYEKKWISDAIFSKSSVHVAVCIKDINKHIGIVSLTNIDWFNRSAMHNILIGEKEYHGNGYGLESTLLMLKHAFYDLGLERIYVEILSSNKASVRMYEKCGFQKEGLLRNAVFKNLKHNDLIIMSILRHEFDKIL